jgi:hypothetical protein
VSGIFLNYRRGDHAGLVAAVDRRLAEHFGRPQVFLDTESIGGGDRYPGTLRDRVAGADVLLAMLHRGWAEASDASGRRLLDKPGDGVRQELEIALACRRAGRTTVIPVLLDDAAEPVAAELPGSLRELALCQARRIRLHSWLPDIEALIPELERHAAATWQPLDAPAAEPPRRPGRWVAAVVGILAALLLAVPAVLAVDDPVPAAGSVPAQLMAAMWSLAIMSAPFIASGAVFLGKAWINQLERHLHRAPPSTYYGRVALPVVGVFVLFGIVFGLLDRSWPQVVTGLAVGFLGLFWAGARSFEEEDRDAELRANWPYRLPRRSTSRRCAARSPCASSSWTASPGRSPGSSGNRPNGRWTRSRAGCAPCGSRSGAVTGWPTGGSGAPATCCGWRRRSGWAPRRWCPGWWPTRRAFGCSWRPRWWRRWLRCSRWAPWSSPTAGAGGSVMRRPPRPRPGWHGYGSDCTTSAPQPRDVTGVRAKEDR